MKIRRPSRGDDGSLPIVLLIVIILAGVIVALFTTVETGTQTARRDRDWQSAFQVADAGIQHAFVILREYHESGSDEATLSCDLTGLGSCSGPVGERGEFTWDYTSADGSDTQWSVISTGEVGGAVRVLEANIGPRQVFPVAMLAKTSLTYNGGGGGNPPFSIGSFGSITLNGTPANNSIASVTKYGPGPHTLDIGGQPITEAPMWSVDDLNNIAAEAYDDDARCGPGSGRPFYPIYPKDVLAVGDQPGVRGVTYCVGRIDFNNATWSVSGPADQAVRIFVRNAGTADSFRMRAQAKVNWPGGAPAAPGDPEDHLIYIESGPVQFSANSDFAGAIYAPNSTCKATGNQRIVGSMVCNDITVGGTFGYGGGLTDVTEGPFTINSFWENSVGG